MCAWGTGGADNPDDGRNKDKKGSKKISFAYLILLLFGPQKLECHSAHTPSLSLSLDNISVCQVMHQRHFLLLFF